MSGQYSWQGVSRPVRLLAGWLTVIQIVGYSTSLLFVWWTTRMVPSGVAGHYRGTDPGSSEGTMQFGKSFAEMLTVTHTHLLSMAVLFAVSGGMLGLCREVSPRWKLFLMIEPLVALLVSFGAMWLMRYVDPRFAWLLEGSSLMMAVTFYLQSGLVLRELFRVRGATTS